MDWRGQGRGIFRFSGELADLERERWYGESRQPVRTQAILEIFVQKLWAQEDGKWSLPRIVRVFPIFKATGGKVLYENRFIFCFRAGRPLFPILHQRSISILTL